MTDGQGIGPPNEGATGAKDWVKIVFELEQDEDGYPPETVESLWAEDLGKGLYRIDSIPFFAYDVSRGDTVRALEREGELLFDEAIERSGHATLRVKVADEADVERVRDRLRALACESELSHLTGLFGVDVPSSADYEAVRAFLDGEESRERLDYEEAALPGAESEG